MNDLGRVVSDRSSGAWRRPHRQFPGSGLRAPRSRTLKREKVGFIPTAPRRRLSVALDSDRVVAACLAVRLRVRSISNLVAEGENSSLSSPHR